MIENNNGDNARGEDAVDDHGGEVGSNAADDKGNAEGITYPGTAAVIPPELPDSNCSDLVIVRPTKEVEPHFLAAFFNSAFGKHHVLGKIVGAAQKHFNVTAAKEVMLHLPPLPEQHEIIKMVDALREETQRFATLYTRKLAALEALKKSLLHRAFSGEL